MPEVDLMRRYPRASRETALTSRSQVSEEDRRIAQQFGKEYFDGERRLGLGGYYYDPRFFSPVVEDMIKYYNLSAGASILDIGCGKGFMLKDFLDALPGAQVAGIDISQYCLDNAHPDVAQYLVLGSCDELPFESGSFDLVVAIATIHNLDEDGVRKSVREMCRVSRGGCFLKVNGFRNEEERDLLNAWNLVAKTILPVTAWESLLAEEGYVGEYAFFVP